MSKKKSILYALCLGTFVGILYFTTNGKFDIVLKSKPTKINTVHEDNFAKSSGTVRLGAQTPEKTIGNGVMNKNLSSCVNLTIPTLVDFKYHWQTVLDDNMYLYSAFVDGDRIRLVGIWVPSQRPRMCQLWFRDNKTDAVTVETCAANIVRISGGEAGHKFHTTYVTCQLHDGKVPYAVSIIDGRQACANAPNVFPVYIPDIGESRQFSVCIPPLHGNFPPAYRLIEWIEVNRLLGVQFFTFFNRGANELVLEVLERYRQMGIVEVLPWNIPTSQLHYVGQIASMHDCLDRNKRRFKYTGFFDLDEFVIPHVEKDITWADLFKRLPAEGCSYSFRSSFFAGNYTNVQNDKNELDSEFILKHSVLLNVLKRSNQIHPHQVRSKVIVKPEEVHTFGVHVTFACKPGFSKRLVEPNIAMLHHYRQNGNMNPLLNDSTALKYQDILKSVLNNAPLRT